MGVLYYGGAATPIRINDESLAHIKVVIVTKLRRNESFTLSWPHPLNQPGGRSTIWLHQSIPLLFTFDEPKPCVLNPEWLVELATSAHSTGGIALDGQHIEPALACG
jgi:hypothetical protein